MPHLKDLPLDRYIPLVIEISPTAWTKPNRFRSFLRGVYLFPAALGNSHSLFSGILKWNDYMIRIGLMFGVALAVLVFCLVARVEADVIEVSHPDSSEIQRLQLEKGYDADIIVYLMSFGDPVDKYLVTLRKESNNKRMGALLSDRHGRVLFLGVKPGKYHVEVSRRLREDGQVSTVAIGDIRLRVAEGNGL